jgi:maltose O-acetyltransferase
LHVGCTTEAAGDTVSGKLSTPRFFEAEWARASSFGFGPRFLALRLLFAGVPPFVASRLRTQGLRALGVRIGHASAFWGLPTLTGAGATGAQLTVGEHCGFNEGCFFELEAQVTIGDHVAVGHEVMFLTRSYETGPGIQRAGALFRGPIVIEDGVWLGARCTIMPGVRVGAGAVIGAGAVVVKDVAPNTLLLGAQKVSLAKWR